MSTVLFDEYQNTKYFPECDGLRAICILMVITAHMYYRKIDWTWIYGKSGVWVFFVLSGYLITMLALREERSKGALNISAFYVRRTFRIFPLYFLVLAVYAVLIFCFHLGGPTDKSRLASALPYYLTYFNEFAPYAPFGQSWSLGVEEKFYLLWPVLAFIVLRGKTRVRLIAVSFLLITFQVLNCCHLLPWVGNFFAIYGYNCIVIGCLFALCLNEKHLFDRISFLGSRCCAIVTLALVVAAQLSLAHFPFVQQLFPFAVGLLLTSAVLSKTAIFGWLRSRPLVFIGQRSYGIYLIHIFAIKVSQFAFPVTTEKWWVSVLGFLLASLLSLTAAEVLHRMVEAPCISIGRKWSAHITSNNINPSLMLDHTPCSNDSFL